MKKYVEYYPAFQLSREFKFLQVQYHPHIPAWACLEKLSSFTELLKGTVSHKNPLVKLTHFTPWIHQPKAAFSNIVPTSRRFSSAARMCSFADLEGLRSRDTIILKGHGQAFLYINFV